MYKISINLLVMFYGTLNTIQKAKSSALINKKNKIDETHKKKKERNSTKESKRKLKK
jgi:hypothetical protein